MVRLAVAALLAIVSAAGAEEINGTVKKVDASGNTLLLTADGKDTSYSVAKDASFVTVTKVAGKKKKNQTMEKVDTIEKGLAGVKEGAGVTVLTDKRDGKDVITSVKVTSGNDATAKKKKKNKTAAEQFVSADDKGKGKANARKSDKAKGKKSAKKSGKKGVKKKSAKKKSK